MNEFPKEVWLTLLEWLKVPDMLSFAYTCKQYTLSTIVFSVLIR
jgi:hypothetical protein